MAIANDFTMAPAWEMPALHLLSPPPCYYLLPENMVSSLAFMIWLWTRWFGLSLLPWGSGTFFFLPQLAVFFCFDHGRIVLVSRGFLIGRVTQSLLWRILIYLYRWQRCPEMAMRTGGRLCSGNPWSGLDSAKAKMMIPWLGFWFMKILGEFNRVFISTICNLFWTRILWYYMHAMDCVSSFII